MLCPRCSIKMNNVMHFEKDKKYGFSQCPKCKFCTHPKRLHLDDGKRVTK